MKRLLILLIALAFVVGALGISNSIAQPPKNSNEFCKDWMEGNMPPCTPPFEEVFNSFGECVNDNNTQLVNACTACLETGECFPFPPGFFENVGACVGMIRSNEPLPVEMCKMKIEVPTGSGIFVPMWEALGYENFGQCIKEPPLLPQP